MPLASGLQFLRTVRTIPGLTHIPVAIVTGDYLDESREHELQALGAQLHHKPLWLGELVTLTRSAHPPFETDNLKNDRFLKACRREPGRCHPVWFMRQAGRYMA